MPRSVALTVTALLAPAACGYYNGMWSADHFAGQARQDEREGRLEDARASWAQAAMRAESVVTRHPHGRWAPSALVLQGEGLAKSGTCDRAAGPLARALESVHEAPLRERAALAAAECALAAEDLAAAARLLAPVTESADGARAARARFLSGDVAERRGDLEGAERWYARSSAAEAPAARARVTLAVGRIDAGVALLDSLARGRIDVAEWTSLLAEVARAAGVDTASRVLDRLLARAHVAAGARAALLLADGDRLSAAGAVRVAATRYAQAAAAAPDSVGGQRARVAELRVAAADADSVAGLRAVESRVGGLLQSGWSSSEATSDARELERRIRHVLAAGDADEAQQFEAGEFARDSLGAARLARDLFLAFARAYPNSLFAPKALVAAAELAPEGSDSVMGVLDSRYAASPYTLALRGDVSPGYAAVEDSLARALGVAPPATTPVPSVLVPPPTPGPRGPLLDPVEPSHGEERAPPRRGQPERRRPGRPGSPQTPTPADRP